VGRKLEDATRRRLESQEATALKMRVSEDRIKTEIIAVKWPVEVCLCASLVLSEHGGSEQHGRVANFLMLAGVILLKYAGKGCT
jgi:hypothetical protein